jgi:hypothetical protein
MAERRAALGAAVDVVRRQHVAASERARRDRHAPRVRLRVERGGPEERRDRSDCNEAHPLPSALCPLPSRGHRTRLFAISSISSLFLIALELIS